MARSNVDIPQDQSSGIGAWLVPAGGIALGLVAGVVACPLFASLRRRLALSEPYRDVLLSLLSIIGGSFLVGGIFTMVFRNTGFVVCYPIGLAIVFIPYGLLQLFTKIERREVNGEKR